MKQFIAVAAVTLTATLGLTSPASGKPVSGWEEASYSRTHASGEPMAAKD